jgi:tetratricopeptide (TPR) repeat protein
MKLKQLILAVILVVSFISLCFAQTDRDKGVELFNKGDFQGAVDVLGQVIKSGENDVVALYNLGLAYEKLNRTKEAVKSFEGAINTCDEIIDKVIHKKYEGIINDSNRETVQDVLKKYGKELEAGYLSIQKFSELSPKDAKSKKRQQTFAAIEAFAPNSDVAKTFSDKPPTKPLQIIKNPLPRGIKGENGFIRVRVLFLSTGKVGAVILLNSLSKETNETVIQTARGIEFKPATIDEKPISVWKLIEYSFRSY